MCELLTLCDNLLQLLNLCLESLVGIHQVAHALARVKYCGVVSAADGRADGCQWELGVLLRQVHRHLTSLRHLACTLCRAKVLLVNLVVLAHNLCDAVYRNLLLRYVNISLQYILRQRSRDAAVKVLCVPTSGDIPHPVSFTFTTA